MPLTFEPYARSEADEAIKRLAYGILAECLCYSLGPRFQDPRCISCELCNVSQSSSSLATTLPWRARAFVVTAESSKAVCRACCALNGTLQRPRIRTSLTRRPSFRYSLTSLVQARALANAPESQHQDSLGTSQVARTSLEVPILTCVHSTPRDRSPSLPPRKRRRPVIICLKCYTLSYRQSCLSLFSFVSLMSRSASGFRFRS